MANIGNLAVQLSLDAALFSSGLNRATKDGQAFASKFTSVASGIGAGIVGLEAAGGGLAGLYGSFKGGLDEIVSQGREAHKLGVTLDALGGLQLLTGKDAEAAGHAFAHFSAHVSEASAGVDGSLKPFEQLNLSVKDLSGLSLDKSLGKTIDAINKLGANDKNAIAKELFGREGPTIVADLERGTKGIAEAIQTIKSHGGIGFDEKGFANALEATRSIHEMESSFNRIKLTLVSELAPVVKEVADWVSDMAGNNAGGIKTAFHDAAIMLVDGLATAADTMKQIVVASHDFIKPWQDLAPILMPILKLALGPSPGLLLYSKFREASGANTRDTFAANVEHQYKLFQDHLKIARDRINGVGSKTHDGDAAHASLFDVEKFKKLGEEAKKIIEETQSPLQKFNEKFATLRELLSAGRLTNDQYATAFAKDFTALASKQKEMHAPGALQEGSFAAHSAEVAWQREQGGHGSIQDQIKDVLMQMKEQDKAALEEARKLVAAVKNISGVNPF